MTSNLQALWKGLAGVSDGAGWQTLGIRPQARCSISAAIRHPEVLEAVMLDVMASSIPSNLGLPEAQGFRVLLERRSPGAKGQVLLILERTQSGGSELFAQMVDDVLDITEAAPSEEAAVRAFVGRIVAWKRFMHEMRPTGLSDSEEIGLLGELVVLNTLLDTLPADQAIRSWVGPEDGVQDFVWGQSAIEVKTTLGAKDIVRISSMDQLDPSPLDQLRLIRVRARPGSGGKTLPQWVDTVAERCQQALSDFSNRLLSAGYAEVQRDQYTHQFIVEGLDAYAITEEFPSLRRARAPEAVREANYQLDLRLAKPFEVPMDEAISAVTGDTRGS
jgi:hypothetical protein